MNFLSALASKFRAKTTMGDKSSKSSKDRREGNHGHMLESVTTKSKSSSESSAKSETSTASNHGTTRTSVRVTENFTHPQSTSSGGPSRKPSSDGNGKRPVRRIEDLTNGKQADTGSTKKKRKKGKGVEKEPEKKET
ncbi:uncharacterized protein LOC110727750 isoform X3 [Chenopodium quinoa]|uniref:uncharacterized protein LOC110727750 isoform X3 n=1 Tax=Chenopodium quinoa TaxID=63459 RepID=UPI000B787B00|nr:uncharacterized protein LOC110727750 isoform X3 [Chenopodium quinoa]